MRLRYHAQDALNPTPTREPGRLVFPRQALDEARRMAPTKPHRLGDVGATIEAELDFMQQQLDCLKDDVHNYRFPALAFDEPPYPAA